MLFLFATLVVTPAADAYWFWEVSARSNYSPSQTLQKSLTYDSRKQIYEEIFWEGGSALGKVQADAELGQMNLYASGAYNGTSYGYDKWRGSASVGMRKTVAFEVPESYTQPTSPTYFFIDAQFSGPSTPQQYAVMPARAEAHLLVLDGSNRTVARVGWDSAAYDTRLGGTTEQAMLKVDLPVTPGETMTYTIDFELDAFATAGYAADLWHTVNIYAPHGSSSQGWLSRQYIPDWATVPEPASAALLAALGGPILLGRRRRH